MLVSHVVQARSKARLPHYFRVPLVLTCLPSHFLHGGPPGPPLATEACQLCAQVLAAALPHEQARACLVLVVVVVVVVVVVGSPRSVGVSAQLRCVLVYLVNAAWLVVMRVLLLLS